MITGGIVLAAVTSMPNAVAAVFLARRGRAAATLSEAFNRNTLNGLAGLLIPAVIIASPGLGGALRIAVWYGVLTIALALRAETLPSGGCRRDAQAWFFSRQGTAHPVSGASGDTAAISLACRTGLLTWSSPSRVAAPSAGVESLSSSSQPPSR